MLRRRSPAGQRLVGEHPHGVDEIAEVVRADDASLREQSDRNGDLCGAFGEDVLSCCYARPTAVRPTRSLLRLWPMCDREKDTEITNHH